MTTVNFGNTKKIVSKITIVKNSIHNKIGARIKHNQGASYYIKPLRYN